MRILHVIQRYWPAWGGAEAHLGELSRRFVAEGHHVTVTTTDALDFELFWDPRRRRLPELEADHEGVRILRFPVRHLPVSRLAYPAMRRLLWLLSGIRVTPVPWLHRLARYTPWVPDLWRWLETTSEPFDIVAGMTICFEPLLNAALRFARHRGIPFVVYPLTHLGAGPRPAADALSRFYTMRHQVALVRQADALMAQTSCEARFYTDHGLPPACSLVAGPGVEPRAVLGGDGDRFRATHQLTGPVVGFLSSMSYDKGAMHLVEAARRLWVEGHEFHLVMAGAVLTPFRWYLERLPEPERRRILVLGPISDSEKRDFLAGADIFAMPSRTDSFGILYLEAWLHRKPVIGARTWGVTDVIADGVDGLLVPFGAVDALARAIANLLRDAAAREVMGQRGEQKVYAEHTWDRKYVLVRDAYANLAARGNL
ncbi:MAG: glycosyltransferase family 4 protein [Anaerolineae bacterium]|nr:glycosyltransferase family 4 protein [Anaerolineae bacterium]